MEFASFLNYAMDKTGITNYRLAKEVGVSQTSVANWRSGDRFPRKGPKEKVLKLFGVTDEDIKGYNFPEICLTGEEQKESPSQGGELSDDEMALLRAYRAAPEKKRASILSLLED